MSLDLSSLLHEHLSLTDARQRFILLALEYLFGLILITWEGKQ